MIRDLIREFCKLYTYKNYPDFDIATKTFSMGIKYILLELYSLNKIKVCDKYQIWYFTDKNSVIELILKKGTNKWELKVINKCVIIHRQGNFSFFFDQLCGFEVKGNHIPLSPPDSNFLLENVSDSSVINTVVNII